VGVIIKNHPKMVNRWSELYVQYYLDGPGPEYAKQWAMRTLTSKEVAITSPVISEMFKERGYET